jgi:hypothetical protein
VRIIAGNRHDATDEAVTPIRRDMLATGGHLADYNIDQLAGGRRYTPRNSVKNE